MRLPTRLVSTVLLLAATASAQEISRKKSDLRLLLTGIPDSVRLHDFAKFLRGEFAAVETTSYTDFRPEKADGFDVVIFDAEVRPKPGRIGLPRAPELPTDYSRASMFVSGAGAMLGRKLKIKIDWH